MMVTFFEKCPENINLCKQHAIEGRSELLNLAHPLGDASVAVAISAVVLDPVNSGYHTREFHLILTPLLFDSTYSVI